MSNQPFYNEQDVADLIVCIAKEQKQDMDRYYQGFYLPMVMYALQEEFKEEFGIPCFQGNIFMQGSTIIIPALKKEDGKYVCDCSWLRKLQLYKIIKKYHVDIVRTFVIIAGDCSKEKFYNTYIYNHGVPRHLTANSKVNLNSYTSGFSSTSTKISNTSTGNEDEKQTCIVTDNSKESVDKLMEQLVSKAKKESKSLDEVLKDVEIHGLTAGEIIDLYFSMTNE